MRRKLERAEFERAQQVVDLAWKDLPPGHRSLLESIGAAGREVVDRRLGSYLDALLRAAGLSGLRGGEIERRNQALGVWAQDLRIVLIDAGHGKYVGLDVSSYEEFLARVAWHEWAHALSVTRSSDEDVAAGDRLLDLAPSGVAEIIRGAGYRKRDYAHEVVAEIYVLLMARRRRGETGRPTWLANEIYEIVVRVTGWSG